MIHNSLPVFKDLHKTPVSGELVDSMLHKCLQNMQLFLIKGPKCAERSFQEILLYSEAMKMVLSIETPRYGPVRMLPGLLIYTIHSWSHVPIS